MVYTNYQQLRRDHRSCKCFLSDVIYPTQTFNKSTLEQNKRIKQQKKEASQETTKEMKENK